MIGAPEGQRPAPRWGARTRAKDIRNVQAHTAIPAASQTDFAALYIAQRFGVAMQIARVVAGLASLGRAFQ
jgi:hypothetical protein